MGARYLTCTPVTPAPSPIYPLISQALRGTLLPDQPQPCGDTTRSDRVGSNIYDEFARLRQPADDSFECNTEWHIHYLGSSRKDRGGSSWLPVYRPIVVQITDAFVSTFESV